MKAKKGRRRLWAYAPDSIPSTNKVTVKQKFAAQHIDEPRSHLQVSAINSSFDSAEAILHIRSQYIQLTCILLRPTSAPAYACMPFGMVNTPPDLLCQINEEWSFRYMNGVLAFSRNIQVLLRHRQSAPQLPCEKQQYLRHKCCFLRKQLAF